VMNLKHAPRVVGHQTALLRVTVQYQGECKSIKRIDQAIAVHCFADQFVPLSHPKLNKIKYKGTPGHPRVARDFHEAVHVAGVR